MTNRTFVFLFFFSAIFASYAQIPDTLLRGQLREVVVFTKFNPAIPIIKKTIQNRNKNGQFANDHFSYISYQKMFFTGDIKRDSVLLGKVMQKSDTLATDTASLSKRDSNYLKTLDFLDKTHLFFMETVSKNYFKKPAKSYEKVIAHHTAGLKDPIVSIYLAKLQTVNFYQNDMLNILESPYVNPVSSNALTIYDFHLEESVFRENDTLFVISFQPKKNAHFKSLTGKIWITAQNYAFIRIEAEPFDKELNAKFNLLQEYERQPNETYFLTNMSVRIDFPHIGISIGTGSENEKDTLVGGGGTTAKKSLIRPVIFSEKKIMNIDYKTRIRNTDIGFADIDEETGTEAEQEKILETYRPTALTDREIKTLVLIDSVAEPFKLDRKLESLKILITGKIPVRFLNIDLSQILYFNSTEVARLGLGLYTNDRLSKIVNFGGFFGYGFKDKKWKWGGELGFNIIRSRDFKASFQYYSTLIESGETVFYDRNYTLFSGEFYRSWLFKRFYRSNAFDVVVQSRITRWLTGYVSTSYSDNKTFFDYRFQETPDGDVSTTYSFKNYYVKAGARFAFGERYWGADKYYFYSVSPYPVFIVQYSKGISGVFNSGFDYNRIDLKMMYRKNWKILGFTNLTLFAGYIDCSLPAPLLLNQRAGYYSIGLDGADNFGTMRADEFLSDKYVTLFMRHNFGRMTQNRKFSPRIIVCQGIGFGGLKSVNAHIGIDFKTMEKGYFESGVMVGDLLVIKNLLSFGAGVFVRYGAYYLPKPQYKTIDNFAFKVSFRIPFER
ncbi:MAG: DUF5686 family protein [Bacteroidetes bacterium]|nr:DUF5686 family protein [Bacteroidota bacterium]MCL1969574.1 DUF5686 family protein [Bacteroidota bacterium]